MFLEARFVCNVFLALGEGFGGGRQLANEKFIDPFLPICVGNNGSFILLLLFFAGLICVNFMAVLIKSLEGFFPLPYLFFYLKVY